MRAQTTVTEEKDLQSIEVLPLAILIPAMKEVNMKLELHAGHVTGASILHRDYVSVYDGRNSYI
jgi:hypothetical protein